MCSKLTIKTPERRQWHRSDVVIDNFKHISHLVLVFLLLTLRSIFRLGCQNMSCIVGTYSKLKRLHFLAFITEKKKFGDTELRGIFSWDVRVTDEYEFPKK